VLTDESSGEESGNGDGEVLGRAALPTSIRARGRGEESWGSGGARLSAGGSKVRKRGGAGQAVGEEGADRRARPVSG